MKPWRGRGDGPGLSVPEIGGDRIMSMSLDGAVFAGDPGEWEVKLKSGDFIRVRAGGYSKESEHHVFKIL